MNLSENIKRLLLMAVLILVIIIGSVMFIFHDDDSSKKISNNEPLTPAVETYYIEKLIYEEQNMYDSSVRQYVNYEGDVAKIVLPEDGGKLLSVTKIENIIDVPKKVLLANGYYMDADLNFVTVFYDSGTKSVVSETVDREGNHVNGPIVLKDFAGAIAEDRYIQVRQLRVDKNYIYLLSETNMNRILQIFRKDGTLHANFPSIESFDIDHNGGLYMSFSITDNYNFNGFQKINIDNLEIEYETNTKNVIKLIRYDKAEEKIYGLDLEGINTYAAEDGKMINRIFTFGEDSTYMGDTYYPVDFIVGAEKNLFIACYYFDENKGPVNLYYQYELIEGVREEKSATLTLTATYRHDFIADAIKRYELKYPEKKIKYDYQFNSRNEYLDNQEQYGQQFTLNILAGEVGDIVMTGGGGVNAYDLFQTDAFIELNALIEADKNYEHLNKNALEGIKINGAIRGLPVSIVYYLYEVNTALADTIGLELDYDQLSWREIISLTGLLEEKALGNYLILDQGEGFPLMDILIANMPQLINLEKKEINLKQDWFVKLLEDYKKAYDSDHFLQKNYEFNMIDMLGKSLFSFRGTYNSSYRELIYRYMEYNQLEDKKSLYIPVFNGEISNNRIAYSNNMYSIYSKSPNKEQAWHFLSFLLEEEIQMLWTLPGKPLNIKADEALLKNAAQEIKNTYGDEAFQFVDMMTNISDKIDYLYDMGHFKLDIYTPIQQYVEGEISLEEALQQAEENAWIRLHE